MLRGGGHRRWRRISYDPVRDGRNRREHGYPLVLAARLFVGSAWVALADDRPLGYEHEGQRVALGAVEGRVLICVFTEHEDGEELVRRVYLLARCDERRNRCLPPGSPWPRRWRSWRDLRCRGGAGTRRSRRRWPGNPTPRRSCSPPPSSARRLAVERARDAFGVARLRRRLELSQAGFARRFGVPLATLRQWEQGARRPTEPARVLLQLIADAPAMVEEAAAKLPAALTGRLSCLVPKTPARLVAVAAPSYRQEGQIVGVQTSPLAGSKGGRHVVILTTIL